MNERTTVAICCYAGDRDLVERALPTHEAHYCPIVVFSPKDSPVILSRKSLIKNIQFGRRAYIGQDSLDRQRFYLKFLLEHTTSDFFLLHDADSFCVSAKIPDRLYSECEDTLWSNEVTEPRPHESPYPKLAFQPPYFFNRASLIKMLKVAEGVRAHPITPYVDWWMNAVCHEAGLKHRPFTDLENPSEYVFRATEEDPARACWQQLDYRIRYRGTVMQHPIKTQEQLDLCVNARKFYEQSHPQS